MFTISGAWARRALTLGATTAAMVFPLTSIGVGAADASTVRPSHIASLFKQATVHAAVHADGSASCGTAGGPPAQLAGGTYSSLTVSGPCELGGPVTVTGNAIVTGSGALVAVNHSTPLAIDGNLSIAPGGTALIGCGPSNQCQDNSAAIGTVFIGGSLIADHPLGVVVHYATIKGDARQNGGGGGPSQTTPACLSSQPPGFFGQIGAPVYSDYEDSTIGGNLSVTNLQSCWFGSLRDNVGGSATFANIHVGDPDANEVITDKVGGNLICESNVPANQFGDSALEFSNHPDQVTGYAVGQCGFSVKMPNPAFSPPSQFGPGNAAGPLEHLSVPSGALTGYTMAASDGGVFPMGAPFFGSAATGLFATPFVGIATSPGRLGYDVANANGAVDTAGDGALLGLPGTPATSLNPPHLNKPLVGVAAAPGGDGYWTAAADGGVFPNGVNSGFFGSLGSVTLNKPVVGISPAPDGQGYYMVAADGGVFPMGPGTKYAGSTGDIHINAPVVGIATDPVTGGYWLVAADGGVFDFNAPFLGSLGNIHLNKPIVGIVAAPTGNGYYLVAADGGIFPFGPGTHFQGSLGNVRLNAPVVGMGLG